MAAALRRLSTGFMPKLYVLTLLTWIASTHVSMGDILLNAPALNSIEAQVTFFSFAFAQTELATKLLFVAATVVVLWLLQDVVRVAFVPKHVE